MEFILAVLILCVVFIIGIFSSGYILAGIIVSTVFISIIVLVLWLIHVEDNVIVCDWCGRKKHFSYFEKYKVCKNCVKELGIKTSSEYLIKQNERDKELIKIKREIG